MTTPRLISFDEYLDVIFASDDWLDACVNMLSVFLEDIESCREDPVGTLPAVAPSIVDQVAAVAERTQRLQREVRSSAEGRGPQFQTTELGAVLWWAGMGAHKAVTAVPSIRDAMGRGAWDDTYFAIHALLYDTISALSLLSVADGVFAQQVESFGRGRPN